MIRDKIVFTVTGKLQELLMCEDDLDLKKTIRICRAFEQSNKQVQEIREKKKQTQQTVNKVSYDHKPEKVNDKPQGHGKGQTRQNMKRSKQSHSMSKSPKASAIFVDTSMRKLRKKCPAWGKTCNNCKGRNHFKIKCKKVHLVSVDDDDYSDKLAS